MRCKSILPSIITVIATGAVFAQNPHAGPRVTGNVESFDGKMLMIKTPDGQKTSIAIPAGHRIIAREKGSLADINVGYFVGSAATEGPDGRLRAEEVHIMDGDLRGVGEGHRPMAPNPQTGAAGTAPTARSMTNATVTGVAQSNRSMTNATVTNVARSEDLVLKLQYKGGEAEIEVSADAPITRMKVSDTTILKPGAAITVTTQQTEDGLVAGNVIVDTDQSKQK